MATKKTTRVPKGPVASKASTKNRRVRAGAASRVGDSAPFNEQDIKRRLGNFNTAGEPARKGGRTSGIVGQTKATFKTDNRSKARKKTK